MATSWTRVAWYDKMGTCVLFLWLNGLGLSGHQHSVMGQNDAPWSTPDPVHCRLAHTNCNLRNEACNPHAQWRLISDRQVLIYVQPWVIHRDFTRTDHYKWHHSVALPTDHYLLYCSCLSDGSHIPYTSIGLVYDRGPLRSKQCTRILWSQHYLRNCGFTIYNFWKLFW